MAATRCFRKCLICGTRGHSERYCPVRELNAQQEAAARLSASDDNIKLGLTPALEAEIAAIRRAWLSENRASF